MEKSIVLLDVEKYNELRDFKKEVEESRKESKFAVIEERWGGFLTNGYTRKYYTENEAVLDFENRNKQLEAKNKELEAKNKELEAKIGINDLKKMSYWEFRKWR